MVRTYSELVTFDDYLDRFNYLKLDGRVGVPTFGSRRRLNQIFYHSDEWKRIRDKVIIRDLGCDLGCDGYEIHSTIHIHHMNPMMVDDLTKFNPDILNPEYLICTSYRTHKAIHYGTAEMLSKLPIERTPNDTCPWK